MKKIIKIYTDGSCLGNPGPGAWACLFIDVEKKEIFKKISGYEFDTTNNRMEMTAVLMALKAVKRAMDFFSSKEIKVFSDSNLVIQTLKQGWKRKANLDLWSAIDQAKAGLEIEYHWVKGHDTDEYNQQCDALAQQEARKALKLLKNKIPAPISFTAQKKSLKTKSESENIQPPLF